MRKKWLLLFLATFVVSTSVQFDASAQRQKKNKYRNQANDPVEKLPYHRKLRWADNLFRAGGYFDAIHYYQQLKQEQPRNPYLTYQLAECYWLTRDYIPAAHYFGEAYGMASKLYPEAIYKQAVMTKMSGDYSKAVDQFNQFIKDNPKTYKKLKKRALREIEGCSMAVNSMKDPQPVNVKNAGPNVNSAYTESAPYPLGDTALLFSTMRANDPIVIDRSTATQNFFSRFMVSKKQQYTNEVDSFEWPLYFNDGDFNSNKEHVGNGVYSPGGERFYFTKCRRGDSMTTMCKIYVSEFKGSSWSSPELLGNDINSSGSSSTQPFIAKVGKKEILFFSSNRTLQSRGGYDIWYSVIDPRNNTYRRPQNAGKQVNTKQDEVTPYYNTEENTLYFSSNGWVTMGGFDVYSAVGGPSRYKNVQNLGYPINTSADELYFIKDSYGKPDAYVVSNRIGAIALKNPTCCDDIWRIQYEPTLTVLGQVKNNKTGELINEVVVKMADESGNVKNYNSTDGTFSYNLMRGHSYVLTGDKADFSTHRASISTMDVKRTDDDDTVRVTIYMDEIIKIPTFEVHNIYYDYNKDELRPSSVASLDTLVNFMNDNPSLSVEIYSFADAHGNPDYNRDLSLRRAESVMSYLESAGIERSRMTAKGFGESMPAAANENADGSDNPAGRQLNRRTELRIISDDGTRRVLFDSSKPGNMSTQSQNLEMSEGMSDDDDMGGEMDYGDPGSRVN
ncbi:MAG: OmpA family protein [Flavipsychrobacter sp.]